MQIGSYHEIVESEPWWGPSSSQILERFKSLHPRSIDLSLNRIKRLLGVLGHPERHLPQVVHVAGTNGKGSTIAFLRAFLEAAGKRTHVYISPHLVNFDERIMLASKVGARAIAERYLVDCLARAEVANDGEPITFFEITTAAALLAFSENPADYLLLECGLGGRLDATNVVETPRVTVITPVSIDHAFFLGDTIAAIASEKAGILKAGIPCVVGRQEAEALEVIESKAAAIGTQLYVSGRDFKTSICGEQLVYESDTQRFELPLPSLHGRHQIENAGVAIATANILFGNPAALSVLADGLRDARWPARLQELRRGTLSACVHEECRIILDGAHNPSGARAAAGSLAEFDGPSVPWSLVLGMMNSKEANAFVASFKGKIRHIYTVSIPDEPDSFAAETLADIARSEGFTATAARNVAHALFLSQSEDVACQRVLICGSLYLAGHVLRIHYGPCRSATC